MDASASLKKPLVSVVVLNYNGAKWIEKCISSVLTQTISARVELIVADNLSTDSSDKLAEKLLEGKNQARFVQHGANLGFCEGNNRAARVASGEYLFFMNNDAWMEPDCLEKLIAGVEKHGASAATPYVMNWADNNFQWVYVCGYDIFGLPSFRVPPRSTEDLFMPPGCSYLIKRDLFNAVGEFDPDFFMYADELDLSWRVWIAGHSCAVVPAARLHHRGAADVNPEGGERVVTFQTSETKRYFSNRNCLIVLLKNCGNFLLLLVPLQITLLFAEALVATMLIRRWSFVRKAYLHAIRDAFAAWPRVREHRRRNAGFRRVDGN